MLNLTSLPEPLWIEKTNHGSFQFLWKRSYFTEQQPPQKRRHPAYWDKVGGNVDMAECAPQGPFSSFWRQCTITLAMVATWLLPVCIEITNHQMTDTLVLTGHLHPCCWGSVIGCHDDPTGTCSLHWIHRTDYFNCPHPTPWDWPLRILYGTEIPLTSSPNPHFTWKIVMYGKLQGSVWGRKKC